MSMLAETYSATVASVTFHTTGWGYSDSASGEITYGDNIILNPNFAEEDLDMWKIAEGDNSTITAEVSDTPIFDDVTTYGKIDRTAGVSSTQDCFSQDITELVDKNAEYAYEFYVMLSDDYKDIDVNDYTKQSGEAPTLEEITEVCFAPYIMTVGEDAEGNPTEDYNYLGTYSSQLSGDVKKSLTPGEWTKFEGTFTIAYTGELGRIAIRVIEQGTDYGQGACVLGDYYVTGMSMRKINKPKPEIEKDIPDLRDAVIEEVGEDIIVGTAIMNSEISDETLMELVTKHFNAVTFGNELKLDAMFGYNDNNATCPGTKEYELNGETVTMPILDHSRADAMLDVIYDWNQANPDDQIKVRGHVLVWHSQAPEWFFHENFDKSQPYVTSDEMNVRLEWYIKTMLEYYTSDTTETGQKYGDMFYGWDVVNEAISDSTGTYRTDTEPGSDSLTDNTHGTKSSWWKVYQSNEFIINAFKFANKYAPADLELYYNDYNECSSKKCAGIVELLKAVKAEEGEPGVGTRIDGMGMQGHYNIDNPTAAQIETAMRAYTDVVGKVQLTELDVKASSSYDGTDAARESEYIKQAYYYKAIYDTIKKLRAEGIDADGFTVWGVIDKNSWLQSSNSVGGAADGTRKQVPLLFDDDYKAKPAYWAFVDPDKLEPQTQKLTIMEDADYTYATAKEYAFAGGDISATFLPIWNDTTVRVKVNVQDATADETDAVTLYVDTANAKAEDSATIVRTTASRADGTSVTGGYEVELSMSVADAAVAKKIGFDIRVTDGETTVSYNDLKQTQDTSSKYYAEAIMKPYAVVNGGSPVAIDGEKEAAWDAGYAIPLTINLGSEVSATATALWDNDNLYVYAEVKDADLNNDNAEAYQHDSLEVFIDENNNKSDGYEEDDKQYRISYANLHSFNGTKCIEDNVTSAAKVTDDGYVIEAAYKWTDVAPETGMEIGLEFQINDADSTGKRIGTLSWYDESGMGWSSPAVYGTVKLVGEAGPGLSDDSGNNDDDNNKDDDENVVEKVFDFEDVQIIEGQWKYEAVKYVYDRGIMGKVGASNLFQPDNTLTRAMFATVLYRVAGEPAVEFVDKFPDVEEGKWYSNAIIWAYQNGIVTGYTTGYYGINDEVTREQIAKMLCEYAKVEGYDTTGRAEIDGFTDPQDVNGWAIDYIKWAVDAEMISGKPNGDGTFRIDPKGSATRAECAKMIQKFMMKY